MLKTVDRKQFIDRIFKLNQQEFDCHNCEGKCCTYEANSVKITISEAYDLYRYLKDNNSWNTKLEDNLLENIQIYRLDIEVGSGKKSFIRRTYTCPFFKRQSLGCPFPLEVKPLGCLGFNSHHKTDKPSNHCYREDDLFNNQDYLNQEKMPIPQALIELSKEYPFEKIT